MNSRRTYEYGTILGLVVFGQIVKLRVIYNKIQLVLAMPLVVEDNAWHQTFSQSITECYADIATGEKWR